MKKLVLIAGIVGAILFVGMYRIRSTNNNGGKPPVRWRDYLPSGASLYCHLTTGLVYMARSYQQTVLASLAAAGDVEAIKAWQELMRTYNPSELLCMMGGQSLDQIAAGLDRILPSIIGMSWATRQALSAALYQSLEKARAQVQ